MKTVACTPCHYGLEYLPYSIQSIRDHVDHIVMFYSGRPTYGHDGVLSNPDSRDDILNVCKEFNVEFIDITNHLISREHKHREMFFSYAQKNGFEIVLSFDYDEVWDDVEEALDYAKKGKSFRYGIRGNRWTHLWKNFNEANYDGFSPIRLFNMNNPPREEELIEKGKIYHFGYAISEELMRYKLSVHGHKSEFPSNWFTDKWLNYKKGETKFLHPATRDYWIEAEPFDKTTLPEFMRNHPLYEQ